MNRKLLRDFTHNVSNFLSLDSDNYKQWVFRYTFLELEKDLGSRGDLTTAAIFHGKHRCKAKVVAKEAGFLAGREEIEYFLVKADARFRPRVKGDFVLEFKITDGEAFEPGDVLLEIAGDVRDILMVERVVLNLLMRMSAVCTFAKSIVDMVPEVLVAPTRKTLWGLLDKKAVVLAGGGTHRLGLYDAILVKDNHLALLEHDFEKLFAQIAASRIDVRFVEVEVESSEDALKAAIGLRKYLSEGAKSVGVLLFDNMLPAEIVGIVDGLKQAGYYDDLLLEASGGINADNVIEYAKTGVDIVSMGCLTGGVRSLDMSLEVE